MISAPSLSRGEREAAGPRAQANGKEAHHDLPASEACPATDEIRPVDLVSWLEGGAWLTLALSPLLYYVHGPAVSADQWWMRLGLVTAAAAAVGSCWRRFRRGASHTSPTRPRNGAVCSGPGS